MKAILQGQKQDAILNPGGGVDGQILTKTETGVAWEDAPEGGVISFNGRQGEVTPQNNDYTAEMVGARPSTWTPTATEVGAIANPAGGVAGQILEKTASGTQWVDKFIQITKLQTICENIELTDQSPSYAFLEPITLDQDGLYFLDYRYYDQDGGYDGSQSHSGYAKVDDAGAYLRWLTNDESNSITVTSTQISDTWRETGKKSVISIYKVLIQENDLLMISAINFDGYDNINSGIRSHAEGHQTTASGTNSHAGGYKTTASGNTSFAHGGAYTPEEGEDYVYSEATGYGAMAMGTSVKATGNSSHAEGGLTVASGIRAHAEGYQTTASGDNSHAEGYQTTASGNNSHAGGYGTIASGPLSFAHGGAYTPEEGEDYVYSEATGYGAMAMGTSVKATGNSSHAEGGLTVASGIRAHAEGYQTTASGRNSHTEGYQTTASGNNSHAGGYGTIAAAYGQTAIGRLNIEKPSSGGADTVNSNAWFLIGCGSSSARQNAFRVGSTAIYGGTYNSSGADYAEYFEWQDSNAKGEDRVGRFVTLDGEKIRLATAEDEFILGIVSAAPSVIGDAQEDQWQGMNERDIFGRYVWEEVEVPAEIGPEGEVSSEAHMETRQKLNPNYDNTQKYTPRSERTEWDAIGMIGKLVVVDDSTCEVNGYCAPGTDGVATKANRKTRYRVMARLDNRHIKVLIL